MERFVVTLKNEKLNAYNRVSYFISAINIAFFIFYAIYEKHGSERIIWIIVSLLILSVRLAEPFIRKNLVKQKINVNITYCLLIVAWFFVNIWLALVHVLLVLSDIIARRILNVRFLDEAIMYPSFPEKNIQWNELENVILKDGILTIDFKNNKLLQAEIDTVEKQIDETAFNFFCQQQLKLIAQ
jgi:hypothetical protein